MQTTKKIKKVLILAYHMPPLGGVPVMRTLRLLRYLPAHNWEPIIISSQRAFDFVHGTDKTLTKKIPSSAQLLRVWDPLGMFLKWAYGITGKYHHQVDRLSKLLFFPDEKILWGLLAYFEGRKYLKRFSADIIYATGFPWTSLLVGMWLKKNTQKPLVLDLRDPWTLSPMPVWNKIPFHRMLEGKIMRTADTVIFTSENTTQAYQQQYPQFSEKMVCIHNGFDPDDFAQQQKQTAGKKDTIVRMVYAGSLGDAVPPKKRTRTIVPLLQGIQAFRDEFPEESKRLVFDIYSNDISKTRALAEELNLTDQVNFLPRAPHAQIIEKLKQADIGVLILQGSEDGRQIVPAKLYEYIAAGLSVLAFAPKDSEVAEIVQKYHLGQVITYKNCPGDIANSLQVLLSKKSKNEKLEDAKATFSGLNLVSKFVECLDKL